MQVTSRGTEIMTHQQLVAYYYLHKKRSRLWRPILNLAAIGGPVQHQIVQGAAGGGPGVAAKAFALSPEPTAVAAAALPVRALSRSKRKPSSSDAMEPTSSLWCAMCRKDVPVELVLRCKALKCGNTICRYCFHGHRSDLRKRSKVTQLQTFEQCGRNAFWLCLDCCIPFAAAERQRAAAAAVEAAGGMAGSAATLPVQQRQRARLDDSGRSAAASALAR
jgi:hypothetical protein